MTNVPLSEKPPRNLVFADANCLLKNDTRFVVTLLITFELYFMWKDEQQNQKFHGIFHGDFYARFHQQCAT